MLIGLAGWLPTGGAAFALTPRAFAVALPLNFLFGMLLNLGIGNYAPSLVLFSLLGMDPLAAFPIMMGSGAFAASAAGVRFVGAGRLHWRAALGLTLGGIPGVIIAAWLVRSLPLDVLRWLVVAVVAYASATLLRAGLKETAPASDARREPTYDSLPEHSPHANVASAVRGFFARASRGLVLSRD